MVLGVPGVFDVLFVGLPVDGSLFGSGLVVVLGVGVSDGAVVFRAFRSALIRAVMASTGESANVSAAPLPDDWPYPFEAQPAAATHSPTHTSDCGRKAQYFERNSFTKATSKFKNRNGGR